MRLIRDQEDRIVLVYELTGNRDTDPRTLVIESAADQSITRLASYPANWRTLKDAELLELRVPLD